ncbi:hypothetical protein B484DRAFT_324144, partial [Ochromonadaceae sp. CCMP2298]
MPATVGALNQRKKVPPSASASAGPSESPPPSSGPGATPSSAATGIGVTPGSGAEKAPLTTCNCKKSRCLKMYCDCFRLTLFCRDSCNCKDCSNMESKRAERDQAIKSIVERNPEAFKPRVAADVSKGVGVVGHMTGCHCKKSACLKKYCECFTGAVPCGERCRCLDCQN